MLVIPLYLLLSSPYPTKLPGAMMSMMSSLLLFDKNTVWDYLIVSFSWPLVWAGCFFRKWGAPTPNPKTWCMCSACCFWENYSQDKDSPKRDGRQHFCLFCCLPLPCEEELEASLHQDTLALAEELCAQRLVILEKQSTHPQVLALLNASSAFKALQRDGDEGRGVFGVYDPKNAKLAKTYAGTGPTSGRQNWWQTKPPLNDADFEVWLKTMTDVRRDGLDVIFVFATKTTRQGLEKIMSANNWSWKEVTLIYDMKQLRALRWKRERGFCNGNLAETLLVGWKGSRVPRVFPKNRKHVDSGSPTFVDVMSRVPVPEVSDLWWVNRGTFDEADFWFGRFFLFLVEHISPCRVNTAFRIAGGT